MSVTYRPESMSSRQESPAAAMAFEDYWRLGRGRSASALYEFYERQPAGSQMSRATLQQWSSIFRWKQRAAEREALASAEAERLRRQQIADMETELFKRGMESITKAADRLDVLIQSDRVGALAAVQLMKLGMEMATRGQRQPATINRDEVVHSGGDSLSLRAVLALFPEDQRDSIIESAFWELQSRGNTGDVHGALRASPESPDELDPLCGETPEDQVDP